MKIPFFSRLYNGLLKHPKYRWVVMGASLIYLVSPIDFSPDLIPIVGWIDDGVVATLLATGITQVLLDRRQTLKDQKTLAKNPNAAALPADSENA
ncbi:YkvA family protein [Leptolyngbya sp. CCNP1308]|uniref:YkvA family protein n=1 Tax=Leptolyngbya sp. CCNP1308 TaxID=3110255 RepID=UPI002B20B3E9|nr:YkvA family protein [Leptolyngbya sp. CCNP1308]MEA5448432.1 YkvA family protein [Leptolyngbya sp. CCNP1308]